MSRCTEYNSPVSGTACAVAPEKFSWRRVAAFAAYLAPATKRQLLVYGAISALFALLQLLPLSEIGQFSVFTLVWSVIGYLYTLSPLAFVKHGDSRIIDRLVPVSAIEKYTFYMLYLLVAVPLTVYLLPGLVIFYQAAHPEDCSETLSMLVKIQTSLPALIMTQNALTALVSMMACFVTVLAARTNRILRGVAAMFGVQILIGIVGGIWGLSSAFSRGFADGLSGNDPQRITELMVTQLFDSPVMIVLTVVLTVAFLVLARYGYYVVKSRNL